MSASELATPVSPGLYVGPYLYAKSLGWVSRHGVTHIVNVTPWAPCVHAHITYLHIAIEDAPGAPIAEHFDRCHAFISAAHADGGRCRRHAHNLGNGYHARPGPACGERHRLLRT